MERELTRVIRRLATAAWRVTSKHPSMQNPTDAILKAHFYWQKTEAVYRELLKIDEERHARPLPMPTVQPRMENADNSAPAGYYGQSNGRMSYVLFPLREMD